MGHNEVGFGQPRMSPAEGVLGERGPVRHVAVWHRRGRWLSFDPSIDPDHEFGRPRFTHGGAAVDNVIDLFRAGEPIDAVAEEFGLSRAEVEDAIRVATREAA
jgi:uncharacterized protein (DUF433 family)